MRYDNIHRRTFTAIPIAEVINVVCMIKAGYGAQSIKIDTGLSLKQVNAIFAWHYNLAAQKKEQAQCSNV